MPRGNPHHGPDGKFASGSQAGVAKAREKAQGAAIKLTTAESKRLSSEQAHHAALAKSKMSLSAAKTARSKAQRDPTEANVKAWRMATKQAIADRAAAEKHGATAAKAATAHEKARTTHALAQAQLREQQRKAQPRPQAPKAVELHPHGVGFERVHGEGETGAMELAPTPEFHFGGGMGRIHGEGEHATFGREQFGPAVPQPLRTGMHPGESSDAFYARRYRELYGDVTGPRAVAHQAPSAQQQAERDRAHQERTRRALQEQEARRKGERAKPLTSLPGVAAVSLGLPQAAATIGLQMPRRDSLRSEVRRDLAPARSAGGHGYNPYRNKGKFAAGPHEEQPKTGGGRVGVAPANHVAHAAAKANAASALARAKEAPSRRNVAEARAAIHEARGAESLAKRKPAGSIPTRHAAPSSADIRAETTSRIAHEIGAEAHVSGASGDHVAAAAAHARAAAAQRAAGSHDAAAEHTRHSEEHQRAVDELSRPRRSQPSPGASSLPTPRPRAQSNREVVANSLHYQDGGHPRMDADAQRILRDSYAEAVGKHGIQPRETTRQGAVPKEVDLPGHSSIVVRDHTFMQGAEGMADHDGKLIIESSVARGMVDHFQNTDAHALGAKAMNGHYDSQRMIGAYHTAIHEHIHTSGPAYLYKGRGMMAEEMVTELSARVVTSAHHGIALRDFPLTSYDEYIRPAADHLSRVSGASPSQAYEALAKAAVEHKARRNSDVVYGENVLHDMASSALKHLGVNDQSAHHEAAQAFYKIADTTEPSG